MRMDQVDFCSGMELPHFPDDSSEEKRSGRWKSETTGKGKIANPLGRNTTTGGTNRFTVERLHREHRVCDAHFSQSIQWFGNKAATNFVYVVGVEGSER